MNPETNYYPENANQEYESSKDDVEPGFRRAIGNTLIDFDRYGEQIQFGPRYVINTSKDRPLSVDVVYMEDKDPNGKPTIVFTLLARDSAGNVVGRRKAGIFYSSAESDEPSFSGNIQVASKNEGIAVPLDSVLLDLAKREATRMNKPIKWIVENENLYQLELKKNADPLISADKLNDLEVEQERWKAIYGENGRFKMKEVFESRSKDPIYEKIIEPDATSKSFKDAEQITLARKPGKDFAEVTKEIPIDNEQNYRKKRKIEFGILLEQLEAIAE